MSSLGPLMIDVEGIGLTQQDRDVLGHPATGGVILFTRNFKNKSQLTELTAEIRSLRSELLIAVDYEGGRVQRFREEFTVLPAMCSLGLQYDRAPEVACEMASNIGWLIAMELGRIGIDLPLTPVVDLAYDCSAVIGDRAFHRDPDVIVQLAGAQQSGLAQAGMVATAKHFPGHGAVTEDSHAELPVDERAWNELAADIAPYRGLIAKGLASVMMAHIRYPAVDAQVASLSRHWIETLLRQDLGFTGAVFCDDLSMGGAAIVGSYRERAALALAAGCDILPVCNNRAAVMELLQNLHLPNDPAAAQRRTALRRKDMGKPDAERLQRTHEQIAQLFNILKTAAG